MNGLFLLLLLCSDTCSETKVCPVCLYFFLTFLVKFSCLIVSNFELIRQEHLVGEC